MTRSAQRNQIIDICRGIGIFLVLYGHAIEVTFMGKATLTETQFQQWKIIYSFHMPLFFFISGSLHKNKRLLESFQSSLSLITIAVALHLIDWIFSLAHTRFDTKTEIFHILTLTSFSIMVTWFLVATAFVQLIFHFVQKASTQGKVAILISTSALYFISQKWNVTYFQIQAIAPGLIFYGAGYYFSEKIKLLQENPKALPIAAISIPLAFSALAYAALANKGCTSSVTQTCESIYGQFAVFMVTGKLGFAPLFFAAAALGIYLTFSISLLILNSRLSYFKRWLSNIGQSTLDLLVLNGFVLAYGEKYLSTKFDVSPTLGATLVWSIGIVAAQILVLPFWKPISTRVFRECRNSASFLLHSLLIPAANRLINLFGPGVTASGFPLIHEDSQLEVE